VCVCVCVYISPVIQHAMRLHHAICGLDCCKIFSKLSQNFTILDKKKFLNKKKVFFISSTNFIRSIFHSKKY